MHRQRSAFEIWYRQYPEIETDKIIEYFFQCDIRYDWVHRTRKALFQSLEGVSEAAGITRQTLYKIEKNEPSDEIKISSLKKIAEAMNCELVYAIRPKSKELFSKIIWEELDKAATENYRGFNPPGIEKRKAWFATSKMVDPKFRKAKNWSKRKPKVDLP